MLCYNYFGLLGCWIIYKVSDNRMHELVSYELMSANDAPERDPMDWYDIYELCNRTQEEMHVVRA